MDKAIRTGIELLLLLSFNKKARVASSEYVLRRGDASLLKVKSKMMKQSTKRRVQHI